MKRSKHDHGIKLYPKLMLNRLKGKLSELLLFIIFYGFNSKKNILFTNISRNVFGNLLNYIMNVLVWTPCLMHRFVCIWRYILQLQTTFPKPLYIQHSACIYWDPGRWKFWCLHYLWLVKNNIQLTMGIDQRRQIYPTSLNVWPW
jgi:hypothetical protein